MSHLLEFYRGERPDAEGRMLMDILAFDDESLEEAHDFIQWLFPLTEPSRFNPDAPVLSAADIAAFYAEPSLCANLHRSFERILPFLGLTLTAEGEVVEAANFAARVPDIWSTPNHNWLRITRILRSLVLLGLQDLARALFQRLDALYTRRRYPIDDVTFSYWSEAITGKPPA